MSIEFGEKRPKRAEDRGPVGGGELGTVRGKGAWNSRNRIVLREVYPDPGQVTGGVVVGRRDGGGKLW